MGAGKGERKVGEGRGSWSLQIDEVEEKTEGYCIGSGQKQ